MAPEDIHIAIADRNSKVSCFLRRELCASGIRASVAKDVKSLWDLLDAPDKVHLLILDPEFFVTYATAPVVGPILAKKPGLPIVLYAFDPEGLDVRDAKLAMAVVEKEHDIEHLKKVVVKLARRLFPTGLAMNVTLP